MQTRKKAEKRPREDTLLPLHPWKEKLIEAYRCPGNRCSKMLCFLFGPGFVKFVRDQIPETADIFPIWRRDLEDKPCRLDVMWWILACRCEQYYFLVWFMKADERIRRHYRCNCSAGVNARSAAGFSGHTQHKIRKWIITTYVYHPLANWPGLSVTPHITLWKHYQIHQNLFRMNFSATNGNLWLQDGHSMDTTICQTTGQTIRIIDIIEALQIRERDAQNVQVLFQGTKSPKSSILQHFVLGDFAERQVLGLIRGFLVPNNRVLDQNKKK